jgi:hypothetical protein
MGEGAAMTNTFKLSPEAARAVRMAALHLNRTTEWVLNELVGRHLGVGNRKLAKQHEVEEKGKRVRR